MNGNWPSKGAAELLLKANADHLELDIDSTWIGFLLFNNSFSRSLPELSKIMCDINPIDPKHYEMLEFMPKSAENWLI